MLQYYLESKLVDTLTEANLAALHAGRIKILPEDIDFVVSLRRQQKSVGLKRLEKELEQSAVVEERLVDRRTLKARARGRASEKRSGFP